MKISNVEGDRVLSYVMGNSASRAPLKINFVLSGLATCLNITTTISYTVTITTHAVQKL